MDNEYGSMFKRLINERNELRKYIIDICGLLDIDTSQSVLGANCLEFYAVLSSVAKDKIKDLQKTTQTQRARIRGGKMNREQQGRLMEKIEYDIKSDMIAQEEKKKIKRSECPYGGIDCAWCGEDCE